MEIPTPTQLDTYYGIGAVNYHTGETIVHFELHKRRREIAHLLSALLEKHPTGTIYVAWDNVNTHEDMVGDYGATEADRGFHCVAGARGI